MARKWIQKATEDNKGKFRKKAEKAGETTREYAEEKKGAPGTLGKEAREAETLMGLNKGSKAHKRATLYGKRS